MSVLLLVLLSKPSWYPALDGLMNMDDEHWTLPMDYAWWGIGSKGFGLLYKWVGSRASLLAVCYLVIE